jgi:hypothetical protein
LRLEDRSAFEVQAGKGGGGEGVARAVGGVRFFWIALQEIDVNLFCVRINDP